MYPLGPNQVALGLVVGLDYHDATLDVHELLQRMKLHPLFRKCSRAAQLLEWGAKTIPEGGYYALPERLHGDGAAPRRRRRGLRGRAVAQGDPLRDAVGHLRRPRRPLAALRRRGDASRRRRSPATTGWCARATSPTTCTDPQHAAGVQGRALRWAASKAGLMTLTGGRFPGGGSTMPEDAAEPRRAGPGASRSRRTACSLSASSTRCSSRATRPATRFPRI